MISITDANNLLGSDLLFLDDVGRIVGLVAVGAILTSPGYSATGD